MKIYQNAFYVPSIDKYFASWSRHDFVGHVFPDGREIYYDGGIGSGYARRAGDLELELDSSIIDVSLDESSSEEDINNNLLYIDHVEEDNSIIYRPIAEFGLLKLEMILSTADTNSIIQSNPVILETIMY